MPGFKEKSVNRYGELEIKADHITTFIEDKRAHLENFTELRLQVRAVELSKSVDFIPLLRTLCGRGLHALRIVWVDECMSGNSLSPIFEAIEAALPDLDFPILFGDPSLIPDLPAYHLLLQRAQINAFQKIAPPAEAESKEHKKTYRDDLEFQVEMNVDEDEEDEQKTEINEEKSHQMCVNEEFELEEYRGTGILNFKQFMEENKSDPALDYDPKQFALLLRQELFANRPQAIKYISEEARPHFKVALQAYVTLNAPESIPYPFVVQKDPASGAWVLHYDEQLPPEKHERHSFMPELPRFERPEPLLRAEDQLNAALSALPQVREKHSYCESASGGKVTLHLGSAAVLSSMDKLVNLFVRFGQPGIELFFEKLNTSLVQADPSLPLFLWNHYFSYFDHLDGFFDPLFFKTLDKLGGYNPDQIECLKKFMRDTGSSKQALSDILIGFDAFWCELELLCKKEEVPVSRINTH